MSNPYSIYGTAADGIGINVVENLDEISRFAAEAIILQLRKPVSSTGIRAIALSGGATPGNLYTQLGSAPFVSEKIIWNDLHFFWGDERHVAPDDPQSNYRMVRETLFNTAPVAPQNIHRVHSELADANAAADLYEQELSTFFGLKTGQFPRFDCVLLGIGPDGHTASLFPGTTALKETQRLVVANWVETLQTHRITMTAPVLNSAALIIILVSGKEKAAVLKEILEGEFRPDQLPVQLIRPVNGKLLWLIDEAAAGCLTDSIKKQVSSLRSQLE